MTAVATNSLARAASLAAAAGGRDGSSSTLGGHTICLFAEDGEVHAVDNRCPHMGFPLHRGTVCDGILTCHWHHARFDLATGGTFDQWADELRRFPVELDGDDVLVDLDPPADPVAHQRRRLRDGLERDIPLVLAKATIALLEADPSGADLVGAGLDFGVARRGGGWFRGLTTLACLTNLLPRLDPADRGAALYHGLADVASDSAGEAPRFPLAPLPGAPAEPARLAGWFRSFVDVRDAEGAERALVSAVRAGASPPRAREHALRGRDRSPLPRRRPHARLRQQGARGARRRGLGARRGRARRRCPSSSPAPSGWRRRSPGAARSTSSRCSRTRSSSCRTPSPPASRPRPAGTAAPRSSRPCSARSRRSPRSWTRCGQARAPSSWRPRSPSPPRCGSRASRRATSSATGTRRCTRSRSRTPSSRGSGARRRSSCCAASSTRPSACTSTAS